MSIIIKGMKLPTARDTLVLVKTDGTAIVYEDEAYATTAAQVQPHGRLIDSDEMERFMSETVQGDIRQYPYEDTKWETAFGWIDSRPTIIEAEGERK